MYIQCVVSAYTLYTVCADCFFLSFFSFTLFSDASVCFSTYIVHTYIFTCICYNDAEICLLFKCRRVASVKAVTVCDLYSLDRDDFDIILKKFPKMKRTMHKLAEERLAQLRDTYGPGWMGNEHSEPNINTNQLGSTGLFSRPSRTREYIRKVEASQSAAYQSSSSGYSIGTAAMGSGLSRASMGQRVSSRQIQGQTSSSAQIDIPSFTQPENVV